MARIARVVVPDLPHHVTQRGNRREPVFFAADDYRLYRRLIAAAARRAGAAVWAYCLMPNHVHLIVTRAQLAGADDELATVAPLRALVRDFAALLAMPTDAAMTARIKRAPTIGRPLGGPEWIAMLERRLGRPLAPRKPGPKPRVERDTARQTQLL
jgi:hypothetical protein